MNQKSKKRNFKTRLASIVILIASFFVLTAGVSFADVYVNGYYRSNGTYVQPHYRSNPDGCTWNNYSSYGR